MEFIGKCDTESNLDQIITISMDGFNAMVEIWDSKSYPDSKMHFHCLFIGDDLIMSDGNGSTLVLTAINNQGQFNIKGYYVLSGRNFVTFKVHHRSHSVAKKYISQPDHISKSNTHHDPILPRNFHSIGYTAKL